MTVKEFRARHSLTGAALASLLGVEARTVRRWEQETGPTARQAPAPVLRLLWLMDRHGIGLLDGYPCPTPSAPG